MHSAFRYIFSHSLSELCDEPTLGITPLPCAAFFPDLRLQPKIFFPVGAGVGGSVGTLVGGKTGVAVGEGLGVCGTPIAEISAFVNVRRPDFAC